MTTFDMVQLVMQIFILCILINKNEKIFARLISILIFMLAGTFDQIIPSIIALMTMFGVTNGVS